MTHDSVQRSTDRVPDVVQVHRWPTTQCGQHSGAGPARLCSQTACLKALCAPQKLKQLEGCTGPSTALKAVKQGGNRIPDCIHYVRRLCMTRGISQQQTQTARGNTTAVDPKTFFSARLVTQPHTLIHSSLHFHHSTGVSQGHDTAKTLGTGVGGEWNPGL